MLFLFLPMYFNWALKKRKLHYEVKFVDLGERAINQIMFKQLNQNFKFLKTVKVFKCIL
jgi:hypothetical protein